MKFGDPVRKIATTSITLMTPLIYLHLSGDAYSLRTRLSDEAQIVSKTVQTDCSKRVQNILY